MSLIEGTNLALDRVLKAGVHEQLGSLRTPNSPSLIGQPVGTLPSPGKKPPFVTTANVNGQQVEVVVTKDYSAIVKGTGQKVGTYDATTDMVSVGPSVALPKVEGEMSLGEKARYWTSAGAAVMPVVTSPFTMFGGKLPTAENLTPEGKVAAEELATNLEGVTNPLEAWWKSGSLFRPGGAVFSAYKEKVPLPAQIAGEAAFDFAAYGGIGNAIGMTKWGQNLPKVVKGILGVPGSKSPAMPIVRNPQVDKAAKAATSKWSGVRSGLEAKPLSLQEKLAEALRRSTRARFAADKATEMQRAEAFSKVKELRVQGGTPEQIMGAMKGAVPKKLAVKAQKEGAEAISGAVPYLPKEYWFGPDDMQGLAEMAKKANLNEGELVNLMDSLRKFPQMVDPAKNLWEVLQPSEIKLWTRVLFPNTRGIDSLAIKRVLDLLNAPRAFMASGDASAVLRQGLFENIWQGIRHPKRTATSILDGLKILADKKGMPLYNYLDDGLRTESAYAEAEGFGQYFAPNINKAIVPHSAMEEQFASNLVQKIPWIKRSEASYTYVLNRLRLDAYKDARDLMLRVNAPDDAFRDFAKLVNYSTGRGSIDTLNKFFGGDIGPFMNSVFFSPKLLASRFQFPVQAIKMAIKYPYLSGEIAGRLATTTGIFLGAGALLKNSGLVEFNLKPTDTDFLKFKIGNTRIDPWAGYAQIMRMVAQVATGEKNGEDANRWDLITKFLQSKESPGWAILPAILGRPTYYQDKEFDLSKEGISSMALEKFTPLFIQDLVDALKEQGTLGSLLGVPAFFGMGVQTYQQTTKGSGSGLFPNAPKPRKRGTGFFPR